MKFTTIVKVILVGFLAKISNCKEENNFEVHSMNSICAKKVEHLKRLTESTRERIEKNKVSDEVDKPLKEFEMAVQDVNIKWKDIKELSVDNNEKKEKSLTEGAKSAEEPKKSGESKLKVEKLKATEKDFSKSYNDKVLDWVESYHKAALKFSELDHRIVVSIAKKTSFKVIEEYIARFKIHTSGFFTAFSLTAVSIPLVLVLCQII